MTNITSEKVSVNQVIQAVQAASRSTGAVPDHFKAEADTKNSCYVFRIEFAGPVEKELHLAFLKALDQHLKDVNIEYKAKRDSARLRAPILHVMREGWYERNRREHAQSGKRVFQAKTEVLSPIKAATRMVRPEIENIVQLED